MSLAKRRLEPELLDDPQLDRATMQHAYQGLRRINQFSLARRAMWGRLQSMAQNHKRPLRVIDLACGDGDLVIWLNRQAAKAGLKMHIDGCDINPVVLEHARQSAARAGSEAEFLVLDLTSDEIPNHYDIAVSSLFFHHLPEVEVVELLRRLKSTVRLGVLIDDLRRTPFGYWLAEVGCRLLSRSPIVHYDGPQSVRAAFTVDEFRDLAHEAGMERAEFRHHWPQRFLMSWTRR